MRLEALHAFNINNMGVVNGEPFVGEMFTSVPFHRWELDSSKKGSCLLLTQSTNKVI